MKKILCSALVLLLATSNAFTSADASPRSDNQNTQYYVKLRVKGLSQTQHIFLAKEAKTVGDLMALLAKRYGTTGRILVSRHGKQVYLDKNDPILGADFTQASDTDFMDDRFTQQQIELEWADAPKGTMAFYPLDFSGKSFGDLLEAVRQKEGAKGGKLQVINKDVASDLDEGQKIPFGFFTFNKIRYAGGTRVVREAPDKD